MFPTKTLFSFILLVSFYSVSAQVDYFPERNAIWLEKTPSELNVDLEWLNDAVDFAKENELRLLASLYLENDYPYKAAKILKKGFDDKIIESNSKNLELLGVSWSIAKEQEKSIPVMEQAASKSDSGDLYARLAQIYLGADEYQKSINASSKALKRKLKKPASVHFNMAVSYFNLNKFDDALDSLKEARKDKTLATQANTWIRLVEGEKARVDKLNKSA